MKLKSFTYRKSFYEKYRYEKTFKKPIHTLLRMSNVKVIKVGISSPKSNPNCWVNDPHICHSDS